MPRKCGSSLDRSFLLIIVGLAGFNFDFCFGNQSLAPCKNHDDAHHYHGNYEATVGVRSKKLLKELAEVQDLKLYGFESTHQHHHDHMTVDPKLSPAGLWIFAPVIFVKGKSSMVIVDSLALFGAGAMLRDAFLHQLPHALGGQHSHGDDHDPSGHAHSLKDLSVGFSILSGIVLFLITEKVVRYVEEKSQGSNLWGHRHHHHHKRNDKKVKDYNDAAEKLDGRPNDEQHIQPESALKKSKKKSGQKDDKSTIDSIGSVVDRQPGHQPSNLVFGHLSVHNFTDGIALGSVFLLHGSVGRWSRTLFLLAHELPQEIGDFGLLVRSGFSVPKALFFNFLSFGFGCTWWNSNCAAHRARPRAIINN